MGTIIPIRNRKEVYPISEVDGLDVIDPQAKLRSVTVHGYFIEADFYLDATMDVYKKVRFFTDEQSILGRDVLVSVVKHYGGDSIVIKLGTYKNYLANQYGPSQKVIQETIYLIKIIRNLGFLVKTVLSESKCYAVRSSFDAADRIKGYS